MPRIVFIGGKDQKMLSVPPMCLLTTPQTVVCWLQFRRRLIFKGRHHHYWPFSNWMKPKPFHQQTMACTETRSGMEKKTINKYIFGTNRAHKDRSYLQMVAIWIDSWPNRYSLIHTMARQNKIECMQENGHKTNRGELVVSWAEIVMCRGGLAKLID